MVKGFEDQYEVKVNRFGNQIDFPIFNRPDFFKLHFDKAEQAFLFELIERDSGKLVGAASFFVDKDRNGESPWRGSFGGPFFIQLNNTRVCDYFIDYIEVHLKKNHVKKLSIVFPPLDYYSQVSIVVYSFLNKGYLVKRSELNYSLKVSELNFENNLSRSSRRSLVACERLNYFFSKLDNSHLSDVYNIIAANRMSRGYPMTMSYEDLNEMSKCMTNSLLLFGVYAGDEMIASSICIKINRDILYVFYWGELEKFRSSSPVTFLAKNIYLYCQQKNIILLDVGTASLGGVPNDGLIRFKKSLGFSESLKLELVKELVNAR